MTLDYYFFIALLDIICNFYSSFFFKIFTIHKSVFNIGPVALEGGDLPFIEYLLKARRISKVNEGVDN